MENEWLVVKCTKQDAGRANEMPASRQWRADTVYEKNPSAERVVKASKVRKSSGFQAIRRGMFASL